MIREQMERIYTTVPLEKIPWNIEAPPAVLRDLVDSGKVPPCRAIEFGCGTGNYAIYLSKKGFDVTGVDISPSAVEIAKKSAARSDAPCRFIAADVRGELPGIAGGFHFAYDWELLHHVFPEDRERYLANVERVLLPGGRYLSVSFSDTSPRFGGTGKYRRTPLGTLLYFSSETELRSLFEIFFEVEAIDTIDIPGSPGTHRAVSALLVKKSSPA